MTLLHREVEQHGGSPAFAARDGDRASVLVHDGLADGQPEPGAAGLGREEWIEHLGQHAAWNPDTGVDHAHLLHHRPGTRLRPAGAPRAIRRAAAGAPRPSAPPPPPAFVGATAPLR